MKSSKLMSMTEAISGFVHDGSSVVSCTNLETSIPFAAGHEIIRQGKKNLTLICPISDILFDQLIGAGCVKTVRAAWVGNVITGIGYNFRRAVEKNQVEVEDHSNFTISLALKAGALGVSFLPSRTALGSDILSSNKGIKTVVCPFTGLIHSAVAAIIPDVAIVHVQKSDSYGNAHAWGNMGVAREAIMSSRNVILTAEEIVSTEMICRDPNRVIAPGFKVSAVVHAPWGAHPSPVPGYYNRDHQKFLDYQKSSRTQEDFSMWLEKWVLPVKNSEDYFAILGESCMSELSIKKHSYSEPVDYGY